MSAADLGMPGGGEGARIAFLLLAWCGTMHISLDLADDVRNKLQKLADERGISLNNLTNDMVRLGLEKDEAMRRAFKPFRQTVHDMGSPKVNLDKALSAAAELEDQEIILKMARRK